MNHRKTRATRRFLSHWGPWMVVAYMGLVTISVAGFVLNGQTVKREAIHAAAQRECLASRPTLRRFSTHLTGVNNLAETLATNSRLIYEGTVNGDPQKQIRRANLARLVQARADIAAIKRLPVPTVAECKAR